jgi:LysR family nitrogen assimilation transcriptional regulator
LNLRRLKYFAKIVDVGSLTQAADLLHIAQPALSQQLATLEGEVRQQLLHRTKRGVSPTEAGKVLYRHAQLILRQCDQALVDMQAASRGLSGSVAIGLAPGTMAATLALPLLRTLRARHPGILPYLNENYGTTLSELVMSGRMDLAVLYGGRQAVHGLSFLPLLREPLLLVGPDSMPAPPETVTLAAAAGFDLYLPRAYN